MHYDSIAQLSASIKNRSVSPIEVVDQMLARIDTVDETLKSYVVVTAERARDKAKVAEAEIAKGQWRGPLHGVPIALKDIIYTDYVTTTGGTAINKNFQPNFSASVVARLEVAGAITLGKVKTTEQAFADHHPSVQAPLNPWNWDRWSGVSSSGSGVSTAAGLAFGTLGSDTGGSIRLPSAANGITGLKPTWGRVSRYGVFALGDTFDHIGPMTRSAVDAAIMLRVIAGRDDNDPTTLRAPVPDYAARCMAGVHDLRIGLPTAFATDDIDPDVAAVWEATSRAFATLGARLTPVIFPEWRKPVESWNLLCAGETAWAHRVTYPSRKDEYGSVLAGFIEAGLNSSAMDYAGANISRAEFSGSVGALFEHCDLFLVPAIPTKVPTREQWLGMAAEDFSPYLRFTIPADLTGGPTITFPAGFDKDGLPIAMQLYGPHLSEGELCCAVAAFQSLTDWHLRHPAV